MRFSISQVSILHIDTGIVEKCNILLDNNKIIAKNKLLKNVHEHKTV
jgi:hypothetical protein